MDVDKSVSFPSSKSTAHAWDCSGIIKLGCSVNVSILQVMLGTLMINLICITLIKILKAQNTVNYLTFSYSESSYMSKLYWVRGSEWPNFGGWVIVSFFSILHHLLYRSKVGKPSCICTMCWGGGQNAAGNESFIAAIYPGAERRMEGWTQFKPNDESSLRAESHETWKLGFFYSVPPSFWTLYWSTNCLVVQEKLVKFSDLILPKAIKLPGTVMTVDDVLIPRHRTPSDLTCRL